MLGAVQIGHDLLTAAGRADEATSAVKLTERKNWLNIAAKMFRATSEGKHIAARYCYFSLVSLHTRDQHLCRAKTQEHLYCVSMSGQELSQPKSG